jgi:hypothetical protein
MDDKIKLQRLSPDGTTITDVFGLTYSFISDEQVAEIVAALELEKKVMLLAVLHAFDANPIYCGNHRFDFGCVNIKQIRIQFEYLMDILECEPSFDFYSNRTMDLALSVLCNAGLLVYLIPTEAEHILKENTYRYKLRVNLLESSVKKALSVDPELAHLVGWSLEF